jgi:hypothetical protein
MSNITYFHSYVESGRRGGKGHETKRETNRDVSEEQG